MSSCFRVFGSLDQFGGTGPKNSTGNGLGYTESKVKSSTSHLPPNEVFRLIFIETFLAIDLILQYVFQIGHAH